MNSQKRWKFFFFDAMKNTANNFTNLSNELKTELDKGTFDFKGMTQESLDNLNRVLNGLENSLIQTQNLINNINESPSDLILKQKI